ncbi:MAG: FHIPEP family type III secretion protein, partial [Alphaproteobacteria bacterium]|nr:FHIPEP family type III secretion protein [Alphaproteobacteria bacterium]
MAEPAAGTAGGFGFDSLKASMARGDVLLALGIICIVCGLIFPLPTWLLDISLALSITFSVLILMTVLFIERPLDFTTFPTTLLIATMLRLSLNVATTRLILAGGHEGIDAAGHVIKAFGAFIMGDNFVIGLIVFGILIIINFVVITKGSGRIAEVAARFSLDAMPGKQMAIDSDMSAGLITEEEARKRRTDLEQESNFYGAMDGAAKFVRGDAIAGLIITFVNIIGGIVIGTLQHDLDIGEATHTYTYLTVGDGLVSQIPALLVSIAAGLLVSKGGVSGSADKALFKQFSQYPKGLALTSGTMSFMAVMPGLPFLPFATLAALTGFLSYYLQKELIRTNQQRLQLAASEASKVKPAEEPISKSLAMDIIRLELGYGLLALVNGEGHKLTDQVKGLRRQLAEEMGVVLPSVRIQDNLQLPASDYIV